MSQNERFNEMVLAQLRKEVDLVLDEEIKKATLILETKIREKVAMTAMRLHGYYSVETRGTNLVITVKLGEGECDPKDS